MTTYNTVSFLSDYGDVDEFVGVVHSVIRQLAPEVSVVDVTHQVAPHDVKAGGLTLARASQYLAPGVVLGVVDPGVGTSRRGVIIEVADGESLFVGPDNGLLAAAVAMVGGATRAFELTNEAYQLGAPGPTFAGRDIFAPAAAHLCAGVPIEEFGPEVSPDALTPALIPITRIDEDDGALVAEVLWTDRYGNLQLNVDPDEIAEHGSRIEVRFHGRVRTGIRHDTYAQVAPGEVGLVVDSYGLVSIAINQASASEDLELATGDEVRILSLADHPSPATPPGVTTAVRLREKL